MRAEWRAAGCDFRRNNLSTIFLDREFRFLHKSLNLWSRLLLLARGRSTVAASVLFPLWKLHLVAPQYPDGLTMQIYHSTKSTAAG